MFDDSIEVFSRVSSLYIYEVGTYFVYIYSELRKTLKRTFLNNQPLFVTQRLTY